MRELARGAGRAAGRRPAPNGAREARSLQVVSRRGWIRASGAGWGQTGMDASIAISTASAVERGLSNNSVEAYGRDLRDFQRFLPRRTKSQPKRFRWRVLITAISKSLAARDFASRASGASWPAFAACFATLVEQQDHRARPGCRGQAARPIRVRCPRTLGRRDLDAADRRDRHLDTCAASATARCSKWPTDAACEFRSWSDSSSPGQPRRPGRGRAGQRRQGADRADWRRRARARSSISRLRATEAG